MSDKLKALAEAGVSIWLDDLSRERIETGELAELVKDKSVVGVTTNPTIFAAAIATGERYDEQVGKLVAAGEPVDKVIFELTTEDVRNACDILAPVARSTPHDGRVSIEVEPDLANDTDATIVSAKTLWAAVDRSNVLIKIPATLEGLPAITASIAEGISVNVTLIFGEQRYREVMDAYLTGLEQAKEAGHDLSTIHSVASFFVSRVDTEIDGRLDEIGTDIALALRGKAAVANALVAYGAFEEVLASDRWRALAEAGANPQRPLWASTGVKNPDYADTMYVTDLVVPETVNTMPEKTMEAFADHGEVLGDVVTGKASEGRAILDRLGEVGVDFDDVLLVLETEGVDKFKKSWVELVETVKAHPRNSSHLDWTELDQKAVDTVRVLAMDAVQKGGNGHPGTAMSLAPAAYLLFQKVMRHNPADPHWPGRDRFVLSCGHSSLTLYLQLFLGGWGLELDDIKALRTWGSKTPGHPEHGHTAGVETTTGPLGQGIGNAVGMAMAARRERGMLDPNAAEGESPFDHHIYAICSDGDIEEGVSAEASALAGVQRLGNLTLIYDANRISIEDNTDIALSEDVAARYEANGWHVQTVDWTHDETTHSEDVPALYAAIRKAESVTDRPSLIVLRTIIAWPAPTLQNTGKSHGSALGNDEVAATKKVLGFDPDQTFEVPAGVLEHTREAVARGEAAQAAWDDEFKHWATKPSADTGLFERLQTRTLPQGWADALPVFEADAKGVATRVASGKAINAIAPAVPELWGGSADLAGSNNTTIEGVPSFLPKDRSTKMFPGDPYAGRVLHFGIREHAMGSIMNGIALHGGTRVFGGTFLTFSDYMRPAVRLAALMQLPVTYVWTHDSIGLGEDGPTHQPIEHLAALRAIPGVDIVRPGDANETVAAWAAILERADRPAGLCLSRQNVPTYPRGADGFADTSNVRRGGYVLLDTEGIPDVVLIGTGSELQLAVQARDLLAAEGVQARVVSMPCREWYDDQDAAYRETVIPPGVKARVSVEAGIGLGWREVVGDHGRIVSIEHYGASADFQRIYTEFGVTAEAIANAARDSISAVSA